jgi:hypothetical protein
MSQFPTSSHNHSEIQHTTPHAVDHDDLFDDLQQQIPQRTMIEALTGDAGS